MFQSNTALLLYFSFYCKFLECEGYCSDRFQDTDYNWSWDQKTYVCSGICHSISSLSSRSACPCDDNQYWCEESIACHSLETPCNGTCPSHIYPIFNQEQDRCVSCIQCRKIQQKAKSSLRFRKPLKSFLSVFLPRHFTV